MFLKNRSDIADFFQNQKGGGNQQKVNDNNIFLCAQYFSKFEYYSKKC